MVAGACNVPKFLVLPFRVALVRLVVHADDLCRDRRGVATGHCSCHSFARSTAPRPCTLEPWFKAAASSTLGFPERNVARYDHGDYVKVEFPADSPGLPGEWMWVRVHHCDEERQILFGTLDNEPVVNPQDLQLGQELAISYGQIREHRKPWEFRKN